MELSELRAFMKEALEHDKKRQKIRVEGLSIAEALAKGAREMGLPVSRLEYEILAKKKTGFRSCRYTLWIYETIDALVLPKAPQVPLVSEKESLAKPYGYWIKVREKKIFLRIRRASGQKKKEAEASLTKILDDLKERGMVDQDTSQIRDIYGNPPDKWVLVGSVKRIAIHDSKPTLAISSDQMRAFLTLSRPSRGGSDLEESDLLAVLKKGGVKVGIKSEVIRELTEFPYHDRRVLIAEGVYPQEGENARFQFTFETDPHKVALKEEADGHVNLKELNLFHNVQKGEVLARRIASKKGKAGMTVRGNPVEPPKIKEDERIQIGENVHLSEEGMVATAALDGQALLSEGVLKVDPVIKIQGDVDVSTGNVRGLGSVVVTGNIQDGFTVEAEGDIEVNGHVGQANLRAGGDIHVRRGIHGGSRDTYGKIVSGKSVWSTFIDNARVEAQEDVIVSEEIVNCDVRSHHRILCRGGNKGKIVGGSLHANQSIHAAILGSESGVKTTLQVGDDPAVKEKIRRKEEEVRTLEKTLEELSRSIVIMEKKESSKDSEALLEALREKQETLLEKKQEMLTAVEEEKVQLLNLRQGGEITVLKAIHPEVKIMIQDTEETVRMSSFSPIVFTEEDGVIVAKSYKPDVE